MYDGAGAFVPGQYKERGAPQLQQGQVITSWASHRNSGAYNSWIMAYDESTLAQTAVRPTPCPNPSPTPISARDRRCCCRTGSTQAA